MQEWQQWTVPSALGALAVLALVLLVALLRLRARTRRELASVQAEAASLRARVEEVERRLAAPAPGPGRESPGYVITALGEEPRPDATPVPVEPVGSALFADLVLRETLVKTASLAHGVRRALAPQARNRIRFEVRREIKRSRRQRRAELKEARRDWESRQRAILTDDEDAA